MEDYPKNSVQDNIHEGLTVVATLRCPMKGTEHDESPDYRLSIGKSYSVLEDNHGFYVIDDTNEEHYFDNSWDIYFKLPSTAEELSYEDVLAANIPNKSNDAGENTSISTEETLAQRGSRYGEFSSHAKLSQELKRVFSEHVIAHGQPEMFNEVIREGLELIFHKIARIGNGDPQYDDNWRDIAGYATLVEKHINGEDL